MDESSSFLAQMWQNSNFLVECSLILLALMSLWMLANILAQCVQYSVQAWQSRGFLKASVPLWEQGKWEGVLALAETRTRSHVATVFLNGLREFRSAREIVSAEWSVEAAKRGACVAANRMHDQLRQGISGFKTIAMTAQFVGLFGTTIKLLNWFNAYVGNKHTGVLLICRTTAESLVPTAAGLLVGIVAVWWFNWRSDRLAVFNGEMEIATLDLVKYLELQRRTTVPD
jgi:biopolymer transport protein ExbB/TolQ